MNSKLQNKFQKKVASVRARSNFVSVLLNSLLKFKALTAQLLSNGLQSSLPTTNGLQTGSIVNHKTNAFAEYGAVFFSNENCSPKSESLSPTCFRFLYESPEYPLEFRSLDFD